MRAVLNLINMNVNAFLADFYSKFSSERLKTDEILKPYTTWRIGGIADLFFEARFSEELISIVKLANLHKIPFFILGGGSNILISDKGIRGLVVRNLSSSFEIIDNSIGENAWQDHQANTAKHTSVHYNFYDDQKNPNFKAENAFVRVDSGYSMAHFLRDASAVGLTGLEWFARIPGTLGGWIYNNTHGHTQFIGDFVYTARSINSDNQIVTRTWTQLNFDYDFSIFHKSNEVIIDSVIRLFKGNVSLSKEIIREVIVKKNERQAANSAGSVFHNISKEDQQKNDFESDSAGYIIDKKLGWLGSRKVGGAWISEKNGNFIETDGTATALNVLDLISEIKNECLTRFNIELREEIFRVGEF